MLTGCATYPLEPDEIPSYNDAIHRTIRENNAYSRGYKDGEDRAIIELMNKEGRTWERYLRQ